MIRTGKRYYFLELHDFTASVFVWSSCLAASGQECLRRLHGQRTLLSIRTGSSCARKLWEAGMQHSQSRVQKPCALDSTLIYKNNMHILGDTTFLVQFVKRRQVIHCFHFKGKKNHSIYLPLPQVLDLTRTLVVYAHCLWWDLRRNVAMGGQ